MEATGTELCRNWLKSFRSHANLLLLFLRCATTATAEEANGKPLALTQNVQAKGKANQGPQVVFEADQIRSLNF